MLVNGRKIELTSALLAASGSELEQTPPVGRPPSPVGADSPVGAETESKLEEAWDKLSAKSAQQGAAVGGLVGGGLGVLLSSSMLGWSIGTAAGAAAGYIGTRYLINSSETTRKENTRYEPPRSIPASVRS